LQIATAEVPEEHMGAVVELLGKRRGQMFDMEGVGYVKFSFSSFFFFFLLFCLLAIFG
jgi:predicted membrane GTPase involved in stress response